MIELTRLNGKTFWMNSELIRTVESTPDTVITLTDQQRIMVRETPHEVIERAIQFRKRVFERSIQGTIEPGTPRS